MLVLRSHPNLICRSIASLLLAWMIFAYGSLIAGEPLRRAAGLEELVKATPSPQLVEHIRQRGDPHRGAILFHKSAAACSKCHLAGSSPFSLGPDLGRIGPELAKLASTRAKSESSQASWTFDYLLNAVLYPSKEIRTGYETIVVQTNDGTSLSGIKRAESQQQLELLTTAALDKLVTVSKSDIEERKISQTSLMPEGLVGGFRDQAEFFDLMAYVFEIATAGPDRAQQLQPSADSLAIKEDWLNLDHAGIIAGLKTKDFEAGKAIYEGYCIDCHGANGDKATVSTARAFRNQSMRFGADPFRMFMTLTRGNGLMGPMSHLTPYERYQVVHYIRERFMKGSNPDYVKVERAYLSSLPKGTDDGKSVTVVNRDLGPALSSQLERRFRNVLSVRLGPQKPSLYHGNRDSIESGVVAIERGETTLAYDLHTMNQAEIWQDGFLDLSETQHQRNRGEGVPKRVGKPLSGLQGWEWGHQERFDYSREGLLPRGPLPERWMKYRGYYLHGSQVILSYSIDGREILESPKIEYLSGEIPMVVRRLEIGPGKGLALCVVKNEPNALQHWETKLTEDSKSSPTLVAMDCKLPEGGLASTMVAALGGSDGWSWHQEQGQRTVLRIPASTERRVVDIALASGTQPQLPAAFTDFVVARQSRIDSVSSLASLTSGGPTRWPEVIETVGYLGLQQGAYALDTISIPTSTPSNTWFRTTALDFLSDGRMIVATHGGDLWMVSGIDEQLLQLRWKRFAAGLYEPMGVKVVRDQVYVTCKDRILKLTDKDQNGEADFYENFSDETDISYNFHAFNFDLQTDDQGNFYYAKGGNGSDMALPGAVIRVSPDGTKREAYSTGFRAPNGMGAMPGGLITCSDNQGHWMPASKVSLLKPGGFYGWVQTYDGKDKWAPDGGRIDVKKVVPPNTFDQPILWMPQDFDNSSGGQIWVDDPRWGPLSGRLLHTSFGKGWLSYMMIQKVQQTYQSAVIRLPFDFRTGIMRGRVNPKDGQVYVTGLQGWNGGGRIGLLDQGIQRLRYTGKDLPMVTDCRVERDGLRIDFNFQVDRTSVDRPEAWIGNQWNYKWQSSYGSEMYSPATGKVGMEAITWDEIILEPDGKSVLLRWKGLRPVHQLHLQIKVAATGGEVFKEEVYWTIHRKPD
jgi:putative heme-binding domain-containing protein